MTPAQAQRKIAKAFTHAEIAYVAIEDVAREYDLPAELVQETIDAMTVYHRAMRNLRRHVEQEGKQR